MNYYKRTEELLYSYKTLVAEIKNLEIELEEIEYVGCKSITYEEKSAPTNQFSSTVENEVINREKQIDKIKDLIYIKENIIKKIDNALEVLDDRSKDIVRLKYFEGNSNNRIANLLDLTDTSICCIKKEVVEKLSSIILNIT